MRTSHLLPEECKQEIAALLEKARKEGAVTGYDPFGPMHTQGFTTGFNHALEWVLGEEK